MQNFKFSFFSFSITLICIGNPVFSNANEANEGIVVQVKTPEHSAWCVTTSISINDAISIDKSELALAKALSEIDRELNEQKILYSGTPFGGGTLLRKKINQAVIESVCVLVPKAAKLENKSITLRQFSSGNWWAELCKRSDFPQCQIKMKDWIAKKRPDLKLEDIDSLQWRFVLVPNEHIDETALSYWITDDKFRPIPPEWEIIKTDNLADDPKVLRKMRGTIQLNSNEAQVVLWGLLAVPIPDKR